MDNFFLLKTEKEARLWIVSIVGRFILCSTGKFYFFQEILCRFLEGEKSIRTMFPEIKSGSFLNKWTIVNEFSTWRCCRQKECSFHFPWRKLSSWLCLIKSKRERNLEFVTLETHGSGIVQWDGVVDRNETFETKAYFSINYSSSSNRFPYSFDFSPNVSPTFRRLFHSTTFHDFIFQPIYSVAKS